MRLSCAVIGVTAALAAASPSLASDALGSLLACRRIEASAARLACFDREAATLAAQRQGSGAKADQTLNPRRTFGLAPTEIAARAEAAAKAPKPVDSIVARISSLARAADGREIFTLDNHQIWVQLVPDSEQLDPKSGETVRISRGWLGSYWLSLPSRRGCKVTRFR
ncbi:MAG: hypothetical protein ACREUL_09880 [Steroidobacteraceae bacterium]